MSFKAAFTHNVFSVYIRRRLLLLPLLFLHSNLPSIYNYKKAAAAGATGAAGAAGAVDADDAVDAAGAVDAADADAAVAAADDDCARCS